MTKKEALQAYRDSDAISQSFLKKVLVNDNREEKKGKIQFIVGSLVDAILTTPELVDDWFYISNIQKYPTPQIKEVFDTYYQMLCDNDLPIVWDDTALLSVFRQVSNSRSKDDKVLESLNAEADYWNNLFDAGGRQIVSQEYWNKCHLVASSLLTNSVTFDYFISDLNKEVIFQQPLYWKYTDINEGFEIDCKGLLDILIVDHYNKTVQIADLKTTADSLTTWKYNVSRRHRTDFQLAFYHYGVRQSYKDVYPDYKLLNPVIILENVDYPGKPRIYQLTDDDLFIGTYGCEREGKSIIYDRDIDGNKLNVDWESDKIYGWQDAINIYWQCKTLGLPDYDLEYYKKKGLYQLNLWI